MYRRAMGKIRSTNLEPTIGETKSRNVMQQVMDIDGCAR